MTDTAVHRFALQDVMAAYAAGVDERDFVRYRECFADDVEVIGFTREPIRGIAAWLAFVTKALDSYAATQHLLGLQHAVVDGDRAHARTDVQATHFLKSPHGAIMTIWATYESDFACLNGRWCITRHQFNPRGRQDHGATSQP